MSQGRHIIPRKVGQDANAWADKLRAEAAKRAAAAPGIPAARVPGQNPFEGAK